MTETNNDHMEESLWEVEHFLAQENIDKDLLNETMIDDMAYHYYKNYNYYDMDDEYALRAAVSVTWRTTTIRTTITMTWMMNMPCEPQSVWYWKKIISR